MPIIHIDMGKIPREQKISLIEKITGACVEVTNIPAQAFTVVINELDDESLGVGGKTLAEIKKSMHR